MLMFMEITEKGKPALKELANEFGCDIIKEDGSLDRKLLASRAFKNKQSTAKLNGITHPIIKAEFENELKKAETEGFSYAVIDAAALLESSCKGSGRRSPTSPSICPPAVRTPFPR